MFNRKIVTSDFYRLRDLLLYLQAWENDRIFFVSSDFFTNQNMCCTKISVKNNYDFIENSTIVPAN